MWGCFAHTQEVQIFLRILNSGRSGQELVDSVF
jgi:hypothetical protein